MGYKTEFMLQTESKSIASRISSLSKQAKVAALKELGQSFSANNRINPTPAEDIVADQLASYNIPFIYEHPIVINLGAGEFKLYLMDFYLPASNTCLEIDGGYHTTPEQQEYDALRDRRIVCPTLRIANEVVLACGFDVLDYL